jgi:hypothetical protein
MFLGGIASEIALGVLVLIIVGFVFVVMAGLPFYAIYRALPGLKAQGERMKKSYRYYNPYTHQWSFKKPEGPGSADARRVEGGGSTLRRLREELVAEGLSRGERAFFFVWFVVAFVLGPVGMVLVLASEDTRAVGLVCLVASVVQMAVPLTPILKARVKRRERRSGATSTGR